MTTAELITLQLSDLFRIGLIVALFATMLRTRAQTGTWIPLAAGVIFVAVMLPMTMPQTLGEPMLRQVLVGLVSNGIILGLVLGAWTVYRRLSVGK
ncbi:hypothetical protein [Neogemmobacter tilapiae]|uniref:Uncharacterized protein n=1 Tax=Neogemmobacter tilapiae TaxID=875041 RepID=A0A918TPL3_9RHOB|nr:hypothetical protein [Gemmobacter tilapiae]GHC53923.1 hypothetical protein GCM10007315_15890 [Gemmobacter tilapiae]